MPGTNAAALDMQNQGEMYFMGVSFRGAGIVGALCHPTCLQTISCWSLSCKSLAVPGARDADRSGDVCLSLFEQGVTQKMRGKGQLALWKQQSRGPGKEDHSYLWKMAQSYP